MKDFLTKRNNVAVSAYITDINPINITTYGALTIVDNSDNNIEGLVPNTYNLFLDNLFIASGYGFSNLKDYNNASYLISTYNSSYSYILDKFNELNEKQYNIEYSYTENKFDKEYNIYGWLKSYKEFDINTKDAYTYISLKTINIPHIDNIIIDPNKEISDISDFINVSILFHKSDETKDISYYTAYAPDIYLNNEKIDIQEENNKLSYNINYNFNQHHNQELSLTCKLNDRTIYTYNYPNILKWRYNIYILNDLIFRLNKNDIDTLDKYNFDDINFIVDNISFKDNLIRLINDNNKKYLDDEIEIEYDGIGYISEDGIECFIRDYFICEKFSQGHLEFYFNNIKTNNWDYIQLNENYLLYQSPQRYIGKHTWTIKYVNG